MSLKIVSVIKLTLLFGSMLFPAIMLVEGEPTKHDLEVSLWKAPSHVSSGGSTVLNATVINKGDTTEYDVNLLILINDTAYLNSTAKRLLPNKIFWTTYLWAPEDGFWNVTAYAPPVSEEDNVSNNNKTKIVYVCEDQPPVPIFTYSPPPPLPGPIIGEIVIFNASSSYDPDWGNITAYLWNFDGEPKEVSDPITTYRFPRYGKVRVYLILRDSENLYSDQIWEDLTVYTRPVAGFNVSGEFYIGYALTFNASRPWSYDPDGSIINYTWNFGDGNVASVPSSSITHTYLKNDTYTVKLTVTDNDNLSSFTIQSVVIDLGYPKAVFSITSPRPLPGPYYVNETLTFDASNSTPDGGHISYLWDFGDGNEGNGSIIDHNFREPGMYNVILTVIDEKGLIDIESELVRIILRVSMEVKPETISSNPDKIITVNITIANVEDLKTFSFKLSWPPELLNYCNATEGDFLGPPAYPNGTIKWIRNYRTVGTDYISTSYTLTAAAKRSGSGTLLTVKFKVLSTGNATLPLSETNLRDSAGKSIDHSVKDSYFYTTKPVANFTYSPIPATANISVTFNASSSYDPDGGNILNYTWDFGDGNKGTGLIVNNTYIDIKTFNVTLTVTDNDEPPENWSITKPVNVVCRDVAVASVNPWVNRTGWMLPINATVKNEGGVFETFNVTLYYCNITGCYAIDTKTITNLPPYSETTFNITWVIPTDNRCVSMGNYTITAAACMVPYEKDIADNNCTNGIVSVIWLGDLTSEEHEGVPDGKVDEDDLWYFNAVFITYYTTHVRNDFCDFNFDGKIDEDDLWRFCEAFIDYYRSM